MADWHTANLYGHASVVLNAQLSALATSKGDRFGDPFPLINGDEPASVCMLTAVCTSSQDIHPHTGYQKIADVLFTAAGHDTLK